MLSLPIIEYRHLSWWCSWLIWSRSVRDGGSDPSNNLTKSTAKLAFADGHCVATHSPGSIHDCKCFAKAQSLLVSISHRLGLGKSGAAAGLQFLWWYPSQRLLPRKPRGISVKFEATAPTMRQSFCCENCRLRTTPESVRFLWRRDYPGFVMVLLSAMRSGVTDNLINELRMGLGVEHCNGGGTGCARYSCQSHSGN